MFDVFAYISRHSFFRFAFVGLINTGVDFSIFFTLYSLLEWPLIVSNVIAFSAAVTNSYLLNKYWSFSRQKSGKKSWRQFNSFVIISLVAMGLSTGILVIGKPFASVLVLKIIGAVFIPLLNYFAYKLIVFKHQPE